MNHKPKNQLVLGAALLAYGILHGYWRGALNSGLFRRGGIEKDAWVLNSVQIDFERNLIVGIGALFLAFAITNAVRHARVRKLYSHS